MAREESEQPRKNNQDCGECEPCLYFARKEQDPETHCIDCTCLFCIPGA